MAWNLARVTSDAAAHLRAALAPVPVYSAGDDGDWRIPLAVAHLPSVLVYPGGTASEITRAGQTRYWELHVYILSGRSDVGVDARAALVLSDAVIAALLQHVAISDSAWITDVEMTGLVPLDWAGIAYVGSRVTARIAEAQTVGVEP